MTCCIITPETIARWSCKDGMSAMSSARHSGADERRLLGCPSSLDAETAAAAKGRGGQVLGKSKIGVLPPSPPHDGMWREIESLVKILRCIQTSLQHLS
jgi:hypothetical protein